MLAQLSVKGKLMGLDCAFFGSHDDPATRSDRDSHDFPLANITSARTNAHHPSIAKSRLVERFGSEENGRDNLGLGVPLFGSFNPQVLGTDNSENLLGHF
jgi:hypothetical protein